MKPLIGLPTRTIKDGTLEFSAGLRTYTRAVELAGGLPLLIPLGLHDDTLRGIFARADGLLFPGGVDVHPREYGETLEPFCGDIDLSRDAAELRLLKWGLAEAKPILGICRGIQMLNVAGGGSLYQDIPAQLDDKLPHQHVKGAPYNLRAHAVEVDAQSTLARALGVTTLEVNSLHHQALKQIAPGFHIVARAPDGIVEGIEADDARQFALGVQFHPEWLLDDDVRMLGIFREFISAAQQGSVV